MTHLRNLFLPITLFVIAAGSIAISNDYYTHGGFPTTGSVASSSGMRAELDSITAGFDKLPAFTGNANKPVIINSGATGMTVTTGTLALSGNFATTGAFNTTLVQGATTSLTLPLVNGTLATLAGTETLTTKTINLTSNTLTGTTAQFNTALSDNDFATLAGSETLTNKTLTSPVLAGTPTGSWTSPAFTTPALTGAITGTYTVGSAATLSSPVLTGTPTGSWTSAALTTPALTGTVSGTYTMGGTPTHPDNIFVINGSGDTTKKVAFEVDGVSTGTTRTITIPDRNITLGGTTLGTEQASTSGTSIDFTGIPSGVKRVTISLVGVSTNGTTGYYLQLGDAGGIEITGYSSSTALVTTSSSSASNFTAGFEIVASASAATTANGTLTCVLENSSAFTWTCTGLIGHSNTGHIDIMAGSKSTSAELDRVRITAVNGTDTFDAGVINIAYE